MIIICVIQDWIGKWFKCFFRSKKTQGHNKYSQSELMLPMPEKERKKEKKKLKKDQNSVNLI